jgi:hypothetical protein
MKNGFKTGKNAQKWYPQLNVTGNYSITSINEHLSLVINLLYWTPVGPTDRFLLVLAPSLVIPSWFWIVNAFFWSRLYKSPSIMWTIIEGAIFLWLTRWILLACSMIGGERGKKNKAPNRLKKIRRINSELTNKSSRIDDLSWNRPITLLNSTLS